jgi:hypothetical protein
VAAICFQENAFLGELLCGILDFSPDLRRSTQNPFFRARYTMMRNYLKMIAWMLMAVVAYSSSMVYAETSTSGKQQIDLGYITPDTVVAVILHPRNILNSAEIKALPLETTKDVSKKFLGKEMAPAEAISAAGKMFAGIDPAEIEQVLIVSEISLGAPPAVGIVLYMSGPVDQKTIFPPLQKSTTEAELKGKSYRKAAGPMDASIYCPDEKTVILAQDPMLQKMLENHSAPKEGKMSKALGRQSNLPDILAIVQIEQLRPVIAANMQNTPVPPQMEDAIKLADLVASVGLKANLSSEKSMTLLLRANDEAAAEQVEKIIGKLLEMVKAETAAQIAKLEASTNPMEKAMAPMQKQINDHLLKSLQPVCKGKTVTISFSGSSKP